MSDFIELWRARQGLTFLILAAGLTIVRIAALMMTEASLGPDEAQYWAWSREPAFGYFSKPPLIAWTIAATTALFGGEEWAVRLAAPLFHLGIALGLFALGRRLYDAHVGFWTGIAWLTLPGAALSAMLITTDAPLLFFWTAALYAFFRMAEARDGDGRGRPLAVAVLLGACIGFGLLAKYAMVYFFFGAGLACLLAPNLRQRLRVGDAVLAGAVALLIFAPNLAWNAGNDFRTFGHTAANANWNGSLFHPLKLAEFIAAQPGVFGIVPFLLLVWGAATLGRRLPAAGPARDADLALLAFALPPLVIVSVQALLSRANANWAAAAFPAALLLGTAWAFRARIGWLTRTGVAINAAACAVFVAGLLNFSLVDAVGLSKALRPVRGWAAIGAEVAEAAQGYDAILVDDRKLMSTLLYYAADGAPIVSWNSNHRVEHHYEAFMAFDPAKARRVLFVSLYDSPIAVEGAFAAIRRVGEVAAPLEPGAPRRLYLYEISDYSGG